MKKIFCTVMLALAMSAGVSAENAANGAVGNANGKTAESKYVPTEGNLAARARFQDAKFGIFLHWGLYSMLATGEWTMTNNNLNYKEYAKLAGGFYPRSSMHASGCRQSRLPVRSISASQHAITRASQCSIQNTQIITSLTLRRSSAIS